MFQGLRQGNLFYVLEKGDGFNLKIGQVISVSNPQPKQGQYMPMQAFNTQQEMFVDVKVKFGEETADFKQLSANLNIANSGNLVVSDNKDAMSAEVESLLRNSKQIIESIPYHEKVISTCDIMLRELNPQFAKEKEQEEKMSMLEGEVTGIKETLGEMMNMLSSALGNSRPKTKKEE